MSLIRLLIFPFAPHCGIAGDSHTLMAEITKRYPDVEITVLDYLGDEVLETIGDAEHIIGHGLDDKQLASASRLKWFQTIGAGVEHLDLTTMKSKGIRVTNASGANAEPVAQHVIGGILFFERYLMQAIRQKERHEWRRFPAGELTGKRITIVGTGAIGKRIAELSKAFNMEVVGVRRNIDKPIELVDELYSPENTKVALSNSDYVVISVPSTPETYHLFGVDMFSAMKSSAILINISRGEIVDTEALISTLRNGEIAGAVLDVVEKEYLHPSSLLWTFDNVLLTSHTSGSSPLYLSRLADLVIENIRRINLYGYENLTNQII